MGVTQAGAGVQLFPIQSTLAAQPGATSQLLSSGAQVLMWGSHTSLPCVYATQPLGLVAAGWFIAMPADIR